MDQFCRIEKHVREPERVSHVRVGVTGLESSQQLFHSGVLTNYTHIHIYLYIHIY